MHQHLVIAGGGQAATQAVHSARQTGFEGRVSLVCAEPHLPYQRPPLSKGFLAGKVARDRLQLKPAQFYSAREVELRLSTRVDSFDPARGRAVLSSGETLDYSHLLLATGSEPRRLEIPGADLAGIHYLRSIDDVEAIKDELADGMRLLVVGAGYIGLEVAAVAVGAGLSVTVLEAEPRAMSRTVCADVAEFFAGFHRAAGVELQFATRLTGFFGDSRVREAETADGRRIPCDLAIVAIGIVPRTALAEAAGLAIDNGIAVDARCRTSAPSVLAAGDCSSYPHAWVGRRIRLESVQNAIEQGKVAAATLCGLEQAFEEVPWFWSDQYDLKLQIAGVAGGFDSTVMRGNPDDGGFSVFYLNGGRVIAVDSVNDPRSYIAARAHLKNKPRWPAEAIADTDTDLSRLAV
ncbi:MAG TPA: FAD-dependent oxidoreductase [Gammaproteobacteria bacterium]|nr:FAD-dependent oxidoreductase [Gammaproteobacteria bacterium]